jgi:hypothetical protein
MRLITDLIGDYHKDDFRLTLLEANNYIPLYVQATLFYKEGIVYYSRPSLAKVIKKTNTIKSIKESLEKAICPRKIPMGGKDYFFMKGALYTGEGTPLMVMAMSKDKYKDPNVRKISGLLHGQEMTPSEYKNFVLFYSTSFFTDSHLSSLNRRFQKEILLDCYQKGIEVRVITSSEIEKNTFANLFEIPKANSVSQLEEYLSRVLPTYLYSEEEDISEIGKIVPQAQNEELSVEEEALLFDSLQAQEFYPLTPEDSFPAVEHVDPAHTESNDNSRGVGFSFYAGLEGARQLEQALREEIREETARQANFSIQAAAADYVMAGAMAAMASNTSIEHLVGDVTWRASRIVRSRDHRPIHLIDDTE